MVDRKGREIRVGTKEGQEKGWEKRKKEDIIWADQRRKGSRRKDRKEKQ
jgi:hypothetical protein